MAKASQHERLETLIIPFGLAIWFADRNMAERTTNFNYESPVAKTLIKSFKERAWDKVSPDGMALVTPIDPKDIERAMLERRVLLESVQRERLSKPLRCEVFERLFLDSKRDLIVPQYVGVSGNRRSFCFPEGLVARLEDPEVGELTPEKINSLLDTNISVSVKHFESAMERTLAQVRENMGKTEGFEKPSWRSILGTGIQLLQLGASQQKVRQAFTDAEGQRIDGVFQIDKLLPELNLLHRIRELKPEDADYIDYSKIKYADLPAFVRRLDPERLEKFNEREAARNRDTESPATLEEVDTYFRKVTKGEAGKEKSMMDRPTVKRSGENNPILLGKKIFEAVLTNDVEILTPFLSIAGPLNHVTKIGDMGPDARPIFELLKRVANAINQETRDELLRQVAAIVKD